MCIAKFINSHQVNHKPIVTLITFTMLKKGVYSNSLFLQKQMYLCLFLDLSKSHNDKLHLYLISNFNNFK